MIPWVEEKYYTIAKKPGDHNLLLNKSFSSASKWICTENTNRSEMGRKPRPRLRFRTFAKIAVPVLKKEEVVLVHL